MITVYHLKPEHFSLSLFLNDQLIDCVNANKKFYTKVALVATDNLDEAFEATNHIDSDWRLNACVTAMVPSARSTSVGDIMELDGHLYAVAQNGFRKISGSMPD